MTIDGMVIKGLQTVVFVSIFWDTTVSSFIMGDTGVVKKYLYFLK